MLERRGGRVDVDDQGLRRFLGSVVALGVEGDRREALGGDDERRGGAEHRGRRDDLRARGAEDDATDAEPEEPSAAVSVTVTEPEWRSMPAGSAGVVAAVVTGGVGGGPDVTSSWPVGRRCARRCLLATVPALVPPRDDRAPGASPAWPRWSGSPAPSRSPATVRPLRGAVSVDPPGVEVAQRGRGKHSEAEDRATVPSPTMSNASNELRGPLSMSLPPDTNAADRH